MHTRLLRTAVAATALAAMVALPSAGRAQSTVLGPLKQLTGYSIFLNCTADDVPGQEKKFNATNYLNTAVEPQLVINPVDPSNLLVGVQQDRWSNGGARGLRGQYSFDGGTTWKPSSTNNVTLCQRGPWQRSSDPWVAFASDGSVAYFSALTVDESANPNALAAISGQTVNTSHDGGKTWDPPSTLIIDADINILNDKNSIWADATNPKIAYVVWDRLQQFVTGSGVADEGENAGNSGGAAAAPALIPPGTEHSAAAIARALAQYGRKIRSGTAAPVTFPLLVKGPTLFSRTLDGGKSWSLPKISHDPGANAQTIANQIVTLPNGDIANFFTELNDNTAGQPARIGFVQSHDKGTTWSVANYAQALVSAGAVTPNLQERIRSADVLFSVAVDRTNNVTYLVWEDQRFSGVNEIAFAWSPDNGFSWTAPVRINQTPRKPLNPLFQQALIPTVAVAADGTVGVTYYDFRFDRVGATGDATDYWFIQCNVFNTVNNCLSNDEWTSEQRLTNASFDYNLAPVAVGHFLGDYMALRTVGKTFYAVFGQSKLKNLVAQYFRTITLPTLSASN